MKKGAATNEPRLCIVGGTARNSGKTTFCCQLIAKLAKQSPVYGLKVSTIFPDEALYHGNHPTSGEHLFEETRDNTNKDTSRMLRAGATQVFYLQGDDNYIVRGYQHFLDYIPSDGCIVCESNSLAHAVTPGLLIILLNPATTVKPRAVTLLNQADLVIPSQAGGYFNEISKIALDKHGFTLHT